jgi:hypothetical protein
MRHIMRHNQTVPVLAIVILSLFAIPFIAAPEQSTTPVSAANVSQANVHLPPSVINKNHPMKDQSAEGGLWRTDGTFSPTFMLKNALEQTPMKVTPVLYMADGTEYDLPQVQLDPAGVAMINVVTALQSAPSNVQGHISTYGSAGIRFQWPWPAVFGAMLNRDQVRSLVYQTHLDKDANFTHDPNAPQLAQALEGTWWKVEPGVTGFMSLTNTSLTPINVSVKLTDGVAQNSAAEQVSVSPHTTAWLDLPQLWSQLPSGMTAGGIEITYTGVQGALSVSGGLEDNANGYSQMLHFEAHLNMAPVPSSADAKAAAPTGGGTVASGAGTSQPQTTTLNSTGIMMGTQEADMQFPQGTVFAPYMTLHNLMAKPMPVQLAVNTMSASGPTDAALGTVTLAAFESRQVDMKSLLAAAGLGAYNGYINLRTTFTGGMGDVVAETGSIDPTFNYVFEVPALMEQETGSRLINYWNTNGDTDSMFTLWNYSAMPQDILLTFYHQEGKYELPVHLQPHASMTMSVGKLVRGGAPDRNGNVIPANIVQGSAKISGPNNSHEKINVAMFAGTFNSRTGTCYYACEPCNSVEEVCVDPGSDSEGVGQVYGFTAWAVFQDGSEEDVTSASGIGWVSENQSVATVGSTTGSTTGVALGTANIIAGFTSTGPGPGPDGEACPSGCTTNTMTGSSAMTVTPNILLGSCTGTNITIPPGSAQSVVVGQQIVLCATYAVPSGVTVTGYTWAVPSSSTIVGGYAPTTTTSAPTAATLNAQSTTFYYWTIGTSQSVTVTLTLSGGSTSTSSAGTTFNVAGPTVPTTFGTSPNGGLFAVDTLTGCSFAPSGPYLVYGNVSGPAPNCGFQGGTEGVRFTAPSASTPSGSFKFAQIVTTDSQTFTKIAGGTTSCTSTAGLDNAGYPYSTASPAFDAPALLLDATQYSNESRMFNATMWLIWTPSGSTATVIDVPIGYQNWGFNGNVSQSGGTWGTPSGSGSIMGAFITASGGISASTSHPVFSGFAGACTP